MSEIDSHRPPNFEAELREQFEDLPIHPKQKQLWVAMFSCRSFEELDRMEAEIRRRTNLTNKHNLLNSTRVYLLLCLSAFFMGQCDKYKDNLDSGDAHGQQADNNFAHEGESR